MDLFFLILGFRLLLQGFEVGEIGKIDFIHLISCVPGVHFTWGEGQDTGPRDTWNLHAGHVTT